MAERRIETSIEIEAPPKKVWSLLTDFAGMATWNPFIKSISGTLAPGGRLAVHIVPPGKSGIRFKPTILAVEPERELRWLGRLLLPGIFDGEHHFLLEPVGIERTRLTQGEKFSGILVGAFGGTLSATKVSSDTRNWTVSTWRTGQSRQTVSLPASTLVRFSSPERRFSRSR